MTVTAASAGVVVKVTEVVLTRLMATVRVLLPTVRVLLPTTMSKLVFPVTSTSAVVFAVPLIVTVSDARAGTAVTETAEAESGRSSL